MKMEEDIDWLIYLVQHCAAKLTYDYKGYKRPKNGMGYSKEKMKQFEKEGRFMFKKILMEEFNDLKDF